MRHPRSLGLACTLLAGAALAFGTPGDQLAAKPAANTTPPAPLLAKPLGQVVAMRRLTETQYRNAIADIFGPDVKVAGRFEPIVRPVHELIASGARAASLSPTGIERFDAMGRGIAAQVFDDAHRTQFVPCAPKDPAKADAKCAAKVLTPLGRYLFRRPLTKAEQAFYVQLAGAGAGPTQSFDKGLELALSAMLVAPQFLYVVETAEPDPENPGKFRLDNYSRAARLSFVLWNTTPGESLLQAAAKGQLTDSASLAVTADAMTRSPRFEQGVRAFFADMLMFERFDELAKDPIVYPYFNTEVAQALPEQTLRTIVGHLLERDGDYRQLFTTNHTFMTRVLASLYRVPVSRSNGWVPHDFGPGDDRAGLIGQAGFLAMYSHSGRSSPTLRGRAIRELLMCQPVPDPPGDVNFTAVQDTANKAMPTARIRLTAHQTDPVCSGCHMITDPIGLSLERFDGIGAFRTTENEARIDASGSMDGLDFDGATGLGKTLAESPDTTWCVASRAVEYATAQSPDGAAKLAEAVEPRFAEGGYSIRALFRQVLSSPEAWRVSTPPLDTGKTNVSLLRR